MLKTIKHSVLVLLVATVVVPAAVADSFMANAPEIGTGSALALLYKADAVRSDSAYLAAVVGNTIYFIDENGALRPYQAGAVTPRRMRGASIGWQTLFKYAPAYGLDLPVSFYSAFGKDNVDLLGTPGALDTSSVRKVDVQLISRLINNDRWGSGPNGGALFSTNCAGCHDVDPTMNKNRINNGQNSQAIRNAIAADKGGMGYLGFLDAAELAAIAEWIRIPTFDCH
jgi:mono/diheme cytochrome c family protein